MKFIKLHDRHGTIFYLNASLIEMFHEYCSNNCNTTILMSDFSGQGMESKYKVKETPEEILELLK